MALRRGRWQWRRSQRRMLLRAKTGRFHPNATPQPPRAMIADAAQERQHKNENDRRYEYEPFPGFHDLNCSTMRSF